MTMVDLVNNQRSKSYVSDAHHFAQWIAKLKAADMVERIRILSRDLDGSSKERKLAEKIGGDVVSVEHRPRD